jgi:hypothetical protein
MDAGSDTKGGAAGSAGKSKEFLAIGKDALELDIRVEVLEQDLRRDGLLVRERRMRDEKNRRDERHADPRHHAASADSQSQ